MFVRACVCSLPREISLAALYEENIFSPFEVSLLCLGFHYLGFLGFRV